MRIKTRLFMLFFSVAVIFTATLGGMYVAEHRIDKALLSGQRAYTLVNQVSQLNSLGTEINIADVGRVRLQWGQKVDALNKLIDNYGYEHLTATTMKNELKQLDITFNKMVHTFQQESQPGFSGSFTQARYYLWNHFSILFQSLETQANGIAMKSYGRVRDMQFKRNSFLVFTAALWIVAVLTWAFTLWRGFMIPLKGVLKAIQTVGQGDLSSRIPVNGNNSEMNGLIISFNSMMDRLQALTVSRKQLIDTAEQERSRIGRELHDGICQAMAGVRLQVASLKCSDEKSMGMQQRISDLLQQTLMDTKRIVKDLRPLMLDDLGLLATLDWLCMQNKGVVDMVLQTAVPEKTIPAQLRTPIFRIVQEASNNAITHGKASKIFVQITTEENSIDLTIEDDGTGFISEEVIYGSGITNIRERVAAEQGELTLDSAPGKGSCLFISFPKNGDIR